MRIPPHGDRHRHVAVYYFELTGRQPDFVQEFPKTIGVKFPLGRESKQLPEPD
jgi:hypothetical protein